MQTFAHHKNIKKKKQEIQIWSLPWRSGVWSERKQLKRSSSTLTLFSVLPGNANVLPEVLSGAVCLLFLIEHGAMRTLILGRHCDPNVRVTKPVIIERRRCNKVQINVLVAQSCAIQVIQVSTRVVGALASLDIARNCHCRSEERRVGKEGTARWRSRWAPDQ